MNSHSHPPAHSRPSSDSVDFPPLLEARNISCARGGRRLFHGLSFELNRGQWLQILGGNGAGKTSLLKILCGLRPADQGDVLWRGTPLRRAAEDYFADLVFVGHRDGVKLKMTPAENLQAWTQQRGQQPEKTADALAAVGMSAAADVLCANLSAGQKRKTALARLLLAPAAIWILDEPLAALDQDGRETVRRILDRHLQKGGAAVAATHQPFSPNLPAPKTITLGP